MKSLRCLFGIHKWEYQWHYHRYGGSPVTLKRWCRRCRLKQSRYTEHNRWVDGWPPIKIGVENNPWYNVYD